MKTRSLHTKIWEDDWFASLTISEKFLFVYLLTNKNVNLNGVYELSDRVILFETGLSKDILEKAKETFRDKILIEDGWVIIRNIEKYDDYKAPTMVKAKDNQLKDIPPHILDKANKYREGLLIAYQEVSEGYAYPNSNNKSNSNNKEKGIVKGKNISEEDFEEISQKYDVPIAFVRSKWDDLLNYCDSHGKAYKDYKAALRDWVKRDSMKIKQENKPRIAVMPQEI